MQLPVPGRAGGGEGGLRTQEQEETSNEFDAQTGMRRTERLPGRGAGHRADRLRRESSDGTVNLTFQIWDVAQRDGMQAMCDAYTAQHPNVKIEVQVTSWNEYWTKLEAAAMSNKMPDIFWMHTNEILKYADNGKLADCSDIVDTEHFSDISLANASGSDGSFQRRAQG